MWLPDEMWTFLFGYLPLSDRLTVRATCKYFRDLVDNSALWKDWTLELRSDVEYEEHFWHMLRRWRVTFALLTSPKSLKQIIKELPGLTTLKIGNRYFTETLDFRSFTNLEHLYLTQVSSPIDLEDFSLFMPQRLTHLTVCQDRFNSNTLPTKIPDDSLLKKLKSFGFHCLFNSHPVDVLHFFLSSLPQLQHLSLSVFTIYSYKGNISDLPPLNNCSLSSLELESCKPKVLPVDLMKMLRTLPFLRSLAILCLRNYDEDDDSLKLSTWLRDLPALTSLVLKDRDLSKFVRSIPRGLTRLTLMPEKMNSEAMAVLSTQLLNLRHLHLQPLITFLGSDTAFIPQYFPRLKTLCVLFKSRFSNSSGIYEQVPDDAFLSLASLKELEVLELQDEEYPPPTAVISKLRDLTNNRVQIYCRLKVDWLRTCDCTGDISSNNWI